MVQELKEQLYTWNASLVIRNAINANLSAQGCRRFSDHQYFITILQVFMDRYLTNQSATTQVLMGVAALYGFSVILKAITQFSNLSFWMGSKRDGRCPARWPRSSINSGCVISIDAGRLSHESRMIRWPWLIIECFLSLLVGSFQSFRRSLRCGWFHQKLPLAMQCFTNIVNCYLVLQ